MTSIYAKTRKGQDEIEQRSGGLGPRDRRLLILIDGKRKPDELMAMVGDPNVAQTLSALEEAGYIEAVAGGEPVAPAAAASGGTAPGGTASGDTDLSSLPAERDPKELDMARHFMMNTLKTFNGPYAKLGLVQRIHDSPSPQVLRTLFDEWFSAIQETAMGRKRADELREKLFTVL